MECNIGCFRSSGLRMPGKRFESGKRFSAIRFDNRALIAPGSCISTKKWHDHLVIWSSVLEGRKNSKCRVPSPLGVPESQGETQNRGVRSKTRTQPHERRNDRETR